MAPNAESALVMPTFADGQQTHSLPSLISVLLWGETACGNVEVDQQSFDLFSKEEIEETN